MSILISMAIFSLSMSISPGPVNFMALTSGLNHGFGNSIRFVLGATIGFVFLLLLIGLGLGSVNNSFPLFINGLKFVGCGYVIFIGYQVYTSSSSISELELNCPVPSFSQGCLMQWLNPKAWVACLAGCSAFNVYVSDLRLTQFSLVYLVVCFLGIASWALLGNKIKVLLYSTRHIALFNKAMGGILCILGIVLLFQ